MQFNAKKALAAFIGGGLFLVFISAIGLDKDKVISYGLPMLFAFAIFIGFVDRN